MIINAPQIKPEWLYELAPHFYEYGTVSSLPAVLLCWVREMGLFLQERELAEAKRRKTDTLASSVS